jgi:hypothetical protein
VSALATALAHSGTRRLWRCPPGETPCAAPRATVFGDRRTAAATVRRALQRLRGRVALPGMDCGRGVTAATVGAWRRRAAHQAAASHRHRRRPLPVPQGQRDARWPGSARQHAGETDAAGAGGPDGAERRHGGWRSVAPAWRWRRATVVGPRPRATAQAVVAAPTARGRGSPACGRAGCPGALAVRLPACHVMTPWARPGPRGAPAGSGLGARGHPDDPGHAPDAASARRAGRRTPAATRPPAQPGLGRTGAPARAAGLGTVGAYDGPRLARPRAPATAGGRLPGRLSGGQTAQAGAAAVAAARAPTPRRDASPMAGAHAGTGGRRDGACLDLACAAHGHMRAVRFSK